MESYQNRVDEAVLSNDWNTLSSIFGAGGNLSLGQGEQRALCGHFIKRAIENDGFLPGAFDAPGMMNIFSTCLANLPTVVENASDSILRQQLFDHLVNQKDEYSGAARILGGMRMETDSNSVYYKDPAERCDVYVKIAECFLEEDETVEADSAVTRAGTVVEQITEPDQHMALILRYKSTYARVLDANRKFLQAASRYHDLSCSSASLIDADDLLQLLGRAATCAILAPSSSQKQRVLGLLVKDERLPKLSSLPSFQNHAMLVRKLYSCQVVTPADLEHLSLATHQQAVRGDGLTILQRAIVEHNMTAVSRLYRSIFLKELKDKFLGGVPAEKIAATMIMDGSLEGEIDQVDGVLYFGNKKQEDIWNKGITSFCIKLNQVSDTIKVATMP
mmetsp:Transcript_9382/g.14483  ORF Transcript_9382/g.14483 Transcript_9382/m.14483 type:complete len:390 (-) Transcript_9382:184-1353(-)|eukprot:CAMPEP_0178916994 /NCGR_PEP_ID=MMETSP0786-20121207/12987_1 /TAXON_ID=186022 /ORGANISM="Thalassionema frauenfeldii, Strain CCMP 1798" /LENGTH=389 /DNA_ID=CAMNT_0020590469 /DNA_START=64 /DNA_END=1233 /DNA_ORIENTATION=+